MKVLAKKDDFIGIIISFIFIAFTYLGSSAALEIDQLLKSKIFSFANFDFLLPLMVILAFLFLTMIVYKIYKQYDMFISKVSKNNSLSIKVFSTVAIYGFGIGFIGLFAISLFTLLISWIAIILFG